MRKLNIVHICDHLGWPGSRMHGVKRLFAWMIPRFDRSRFNVSLISLRKRDLSDDTLESLGIDVTYMHRSKFDPATLPALLKELDRRGADVLHMHGYGATTFGRLAAARRGLPAILHEHANLTDTPWFQKIADRLLAPYTDIAIAVSRSTADFVIRRRLIPPERTKVVYLGVPLEEFSRPRSSDEVAAARAALGIPPGTLAVGTITRLMPSKGNEFLIQAMKPVVERLPNARCYIVGEGELQGELEAVCRAKRRSRQSGAPRVPERCRRGAVRIRPRGVSVAVGRDAADGARGAGDGEADRLDRRRRPAGCADRRTSTP